MTHIHTFQISITKSNNSPSGYALRFDKKTEHSQAGLLWMTGFIRLSSTQWETLQSEVKNNQISDTRIIELFGIPTHWV